MIKKIILLLIMGFVSVSTVSAKTDKSSAEYLQNKKHFSVLNPFVESIAEKSIKKSLKKSTGEKFNVKFDSYTLQSLKKGVFKNLELEAKKIQINGIDVDYINIKTLTNYNKIDLDKKPLAIETDMTCAYELHLRENSINQALDHKDYKKTLEKINKLAYPLFTLEDVMVKIKNNKLCVIMEYNFPISPSKKNKTFMVKTGLKLERNRLLADNVHIDSSYGALPVEKVTNLINLLDPLTFTLDLLNTKKCNTRIENVKIIDNIIQINGKIYVRGDKNKTS